MQEGLISIVVPNYNYARFLPHCLESVLAQTYPHWELIVVDDNSRDDSREIVRRFQADHPNHPVHLIHHRQGPSGTPTPVNLGLQAMSGEFFAWLSSDDCFHPRKLERQVAEMRRRPELVMSYTRADEIDADGLVLRKSPLVTPAGRLNFLLELLRRNFINGNTVLIRKTALDRVGPLLAGSVDHPDLWRAAEYLWWLKLALLGPVAGLNEILHHFRVHDVNSPFNRSDFGLHLKAELMTRFAREYDAATIAAMIGLDEYDAVVCEAHLRRELERSGCGTVTWERHHRGRERDPLREAEVHRYREGIGRAEYLYKAGEFFWDSGRQAQAAECIAAAEQLAPHAATPRALYIRAAHAAAEKDWPKAEACYREVLERVADVSSPFRSAAAFHLGGIARDVHGDTARAVEFWRLCLEENPRHRQAAENLAAAGAAAGEDYWQQGALADPLGVIADVASTAEFELTGLCDANLVVRHLGRGGFRRALEIGCGIGRVMKPMARCCAEIGGVDTSAAMIAQAGRYLAGIANAFVLHVTGTDTGLAAGSFDLVYSHLVFMHLPLAECRAWIAEAARLLQADGVFWLQMFTDTAAPGVLAPDDPRRSGQVRAYRPEELRPLLETRFAEVEIFTDPLDRTAGRQWHFCLCRRPLGRG